MENSQRASNDLIVAETLKRKASEGDHLVEEDPVRPDVGHRREEAVGQTLRGHPAHRQHPLPAEPIVVVLVHGPGKKSSSFFLTAFVKSIA